MWPWKFFGSSKSGFDPFKFMNEDEFQQMLDQWMKQAFPHFIQSMINEKAVNNPNISDEKNQDFYGLNEQVFETHDDVFIRVPVKDETQLKQMKIYYSLNKCVIDGLEDKNSPYTIILPATVKKKGAKAIYRDQVLEIKMPKSIEWQMSEIDVDKY